MAKKAHRLQIVGLSLYDQIKRMIKKRVHVLRDILDVYNNSNRLHVDNALALGRFQFNFR